MMPTKRPDWTISAHVRLVVTGRPLDVAHRVNVLVRLWRRAVHVEDWGVALKLAQEIDVLR